MSRTLLSFKIFVEQVFEIGFKESSFRLEQRVNKASLKIRKEKHSQDLTCLK